MQLPLKLGVAVAVLASATDIYAQMRFRGMDSNNDGVITRQEWRGTDLAFRNQDWDGDGVLSGDEVRQGAQRLTWSQDWNRDGRVDNVDQQIAQRFRGYDVNGDNRVVRSEWPGDGRLFNRLDSNRDGYLTIQEYTSGGGFRADALGGPAFGFMTMDTSRDGWITRDEWRMGHTDFDRLDVNHDNRITRFEFENDTAGYRDHRYAAGQFNRLDENRDGWITRSESRMTNTVFDHIDVNNDNRITRFEFESAASYQDEVYDRFSSVDTNRDGWLNRSEWRGTENAFTRLDTNRDNRLSQSEYDARISPTSPEPARSAAWRMGYDRGISEGRQAGREDVAGNRGWDLEGQRELVHADAGYLPGMGSRSEYQAGYREGFRNAYREGFYLAKEGK
jgi:Ca2+-binding EF-hand superfamily protein